jgi:hypothetical protein
MSEVIPEDEDRGGDGAIGGALEGGALEGEADDDEQGAGTDDGGPGSQNM